MQRVIWFELHAVESLIGQRIIWNIFFLGWHQRCMKQRGFYCFSSSSVTLNGLKQMLVVPMNCKNYSPLPNIFSCDIH